MDKKKAGRKNGRNRAGKGNKSSRSSDETREVLMTKKLHKLQSIRAQAGSSSKVDREDDRQSRAYSPEMETPGYYRTMSQFADAKLPAWKQTVPMKGIHSLGTDTVVREISFKPANKRDAQNAQQFGEMLRNAFQGLNDSNSRLPFKGESILERNVREKLNISMMNARLRGEQPSKHLPLPEKDQEFLQSIKNSSSIISNMAMEDARLEVEKLMRKDPRCSYSDKNAPKPFPSKQVDPSQSSKDGEDLNIKCTSAKPAVPKRVFQVNESTQEFCPLKKLKDIPDGSDSTDSHTSVPTSFEENITVPKKRVFFSREDCIADAIKNPEQKIADDDDALMPISLSTKMRVYDTIRQLRDAKKEEERANMEAEYLMASRVPPPDIYKQILRSPKVYPSTVPSNAQCCFITFPEAVACPNPPQRNYTQRLRALVRTARMPLLLVPSVENDSNQFVCLNHYRFITEYKFNADGPPKLAMHSIEDAVEVTTTDLYPEEQGYQQVSPAELANDPIRKIYSFLDLLTERIQYYQREVTEANKLKDSALANAKKALQLFMKKKLEGKVISPAAHCRAAQISDFLFQTHEVESFDRSKLGSVAKFMMQFVGLLNLAVRQADYSEIAAAYHRLLGDDRDPEEQNLPLFMQLILAFEDYAEFLESPLICDKLFELRTKSGLADIAKLMKTKFDCSNSHAMTDEQMLSYVDVVREKADTLAEKLAETARELKMDELSAELFPDLAEQQRKDESDAEDDPDDFWFKTPAESDFINYLRLAATPQNTGDLMNELSDEEASSSPGKLVCDDCDVDPCTCPINYEHVERMRGKIAAEYSKDKPPKENMPADVQRKREIVEKLGSQSLGRYLNKFNLQVPGGSSKMELVDEVASHWKNLRVQHVQAEVNEKMRYLNLRKKNDDRKRSHILAGTSGTSGVPSTSK